MNQVVIQKVFSGWSVNQSQQEFLKKMKGFKISKVPVVLRRWKSETMKFGMKRDDNGMFSLPSR